VIGAGFLLAALGLGTACLTLSLILLLPFLLLAAAGISSCHPVAFPLLEESFPANGGGPQEKQSGIYRHPGLVYAFREVAHEETAVSPVLKILAPLLGLALFCLAVSVLYRELQALPATRLVLALAAAASYLAATGYDTLGARYVQRRLAYRRTAPAAFIGTTFSNDLGFGLLTCGSIRLRLYSTWELSVV